MNNSRNLGDGSVISIRLLTADGLKGPQHISNRLDLSDEEWQKRLSPEQYRILRRHGTEPAFCGLLTDEKEDGLYFCSGCGLPLFSSDAKFSSGTGWPSFFQAFAPENIIEIRDQSFGMIRTEIRCTRCGGHLGHVFPDGPKPSGLRYCLNSEALHFVPIDRLSDAPKEAFENAGQKLEKAIFAAGCFWGVEEAFRKLPGIVDAAVGYTGGSTSNPSYKQVCTGATGHAEAVEIVYDPSITSYAALVDAFFAMHDPTQYNRQGPDYGTQYRSGIFTIDDEQFAVAQRLKSEQEASGRFKKPIVTVIEKAGPFWPAEEYHQRYFEKNGGHSCHF